LLTLGLTLAIVAIAAGCADDRALIDRTLDRREAALNARDADAYAKLFAPDYVKADPNFNPRAEMQALFGKLASVHYQAFSRNVQFEDKQTARVIQQYRMVLGAADGATKTINGVDHFMMKRHGVWPFNSWLFYRGLDSAPQKPTAPAAAQPAAPTGGSE
jgi:ketosteroid isomerase-like protein